MILFASLGALIAVAALLLLLRPLLWGKRSEAVSRDAANVSIYRDQLRELDADLAAGSLSQSDYQRSRAEIEARLLEDVRHAERPAAGGGRRAALVGALALPLCAVLVYLAVGAPGAMLPRDGEQVNAMVARLAAQLRENPDDGNGWRLLGRSYLVLGRYDDAVQAYARAAAKFPRDANVLADFADALGMARGQSLQGEPEQLILRALELDPANLKALALAGTAAFERKAYAAAGGFWQRMLPLVQADSEDARTIRENVEEAIRLSKSEGAAGTQVSGTVGIAPALKGRPRPEDTLFVFARAAEGPPMPLAVLKARAGELPLRFSLDDSMAMAPGLALSRFPKVVLTARISRSGQATAQAGDLQGASQPVANDAKNVSVLIDTVVR